MTGPINFLTSSRSRLPNGSPITRVHHIFQASLNNLEINTEESDEGARELGCIFFLYIQALYSKTTKFSYLPKIK